MYEQIFQILLLIVVAGLSLIFGSLLYDLGKLIQNKANSYTQIDSFAKSAMTTLEKLFNDKQSELDQERAEDLNRMYEENEVLREQLEQQKQLTQLANERTLDLQQKLRQASTGKYQDQLEAENEGLKAQAIELQKKLDIAMDLIEP